MATAMLVGACGGSGDAKQASPDIANTSDPAAGGKAANATGGDRAFCDAVMAQFAQLASAGDASSLDAGVRQQYFIMQKELTAKVREAAPSGLRRDVEIQTRPSDGLADARLRGDAAAAAAASTQMNSPETQAAVTRVSAYVKDHCGFEATTGG
jgi:hypothetical protein